VLTTYHFIYPEDRFLETVQRAIWTAEWLADRVVLLGASPSSPEPEYGWIRLGPSLAGTVGAVIKCPAPLKQVKTFRALRKREN
jgi:mannose-1-phosphate guanylyltransferase